MNIFDKIKSWLQDLTRRESIRQLGFIYSSRMVTAAMRFIVSIVVARTLGAQRLGVLTIAAVFMGIFEKLLEMGLTTTMVRKMSLHVSRGEIDESVVMFRKIYVFKLTIAAVFVVFAWFLAPWIAVRFYGNPELVIPLRIAAAGALIWNVWNQLDAVLRAMEKFKEIAIINIISHLVRTGLILFFAWKAVLGVSNMLVFNISQVFVAFVITSFIIPKIFHTRKTRGKSSLREIFAYSKWMYIFSLIFMLFDRLDVLMLGYFRQESEVGIYAVAFMLIKPFELIPETFNTVFLPKVSKFTRKLEIYRYFRDTLKVTGFIALLCVILMFAAEPLILTFYGPDYSESVRLFQILVGAYILLTMLNPFNLVGHSLNKPQLFVIMVSINLVLNFTGNIIFIPKYGALGAAMVTLVSRVIGGILGLLVLKIYLSRWKEES